MVNLENKNTDKQISEMVITRNYKIILRDYNNTELKIGALPKAVYFLFLRYPEGIICKQIHKHYNELVNIYKQLRPCTEIGQIKATINNISAPESNAINENIARINIAFRTIFKDYNIDEYLIKGTRGSAYSIHLKRSMITWEE